MVSFCRQIFLWDSFDRFLSIFFKTSKISEKIMIFVHQNGAWVLVVTVESIKPIKNGVFPWYAEYLLEQALRLEKMINFQIFYFFWKVWEKSFPTPGRTSLYDINSRFLFELKFLRKITFSTKCIKMHEIMSNWHFFATLRGATEARFSRTELGRGSKCQERSIIFVLNKIKVFVNFWIGRRISNVPRKNGYFAVF